MRRTRLSFGLGMGPSDCCGPTARGARCCSSARHPGAISRLLDSETAVTIGVDVAARLWRPAATPFRWIGDHVERWLADATPGSAPGRRLLLRARELFDQLDVRGDTLVHGDFHHHNILDAGSR